MYTFKLVSVSAIFLLALMPGVVSQEVEGVPLGGSCKTPLPYLEYLLNRYLLGETKIGFVCIETMEIFVLLTTRYPIFNRNLVRLCALLNRHVNCLL
ncbi:hypothetical protein B0H13DRAFT_1178903 [Mycena leptocephala]|nr:hypothetical protein B0H13DRAFT_1178903 [Mycena leptocephala]